MRRGAPVGPAATCSTRTDRGGCGDACEDREKKNKEERSGEEKKGGVQRRKKMVIMKKGGLASWRRSMHLKFGSA
eukprot:1148111-Pleurochrysis_carterae.AAC.3